MVLRRQRKELNITQPRRLVKCPRFRQHEGGGGLGVQDGALTSHTAPGAFFSWISAFSSSPPSLATNLTNGLAGSGDPEVTGHIFSKGREVAELKRIATSQPRSSNNGAARGEAHARGRALRGQPPRAASGCSLKENTLWKSPPPLPFPPVTVVVVL